MDWIFGNYLHIVLAEIHRLQIGLSCVYFSLLRNHVLQLSPPLLSPHPLCLSLSIPLSSSPAHSIIATTNRALHRRPVFRPTSLDSTSILLITIIIQIKLTGHLVYSVFSFSWKNKQINPIKKNTTATLMVEAGTLFSGSTRWGGY